MLWTNERKGSSMFSVHAYNIINFKHEHFDGGVVVAGRFWYWNWICFCSWFLVFVAFVFGLTEWSSFGLVIIIWYFGCDFEHTLHTIFNALVGYLKRQKKWDNLSIKRLKTTTGPLKKKYERLYTVCSLCTVHSKKKKPKRTKQRKEKWSYKLQRI